MRKFRITIECNGVEITGKLHDIIQVLVKAFKVTSPTVYQIYGEIGVASIDENQQSFVRTYPENVKVFFEATAIGSSQFNLNDGYAAFSQQSNQNS